MYREDGKHDPDRVLGFGEGATVCLSANRHDSLRWEGGQEVKEGASYQGAQSFRLFALAAKLLRCCMSLVAVVRVLEANR